MGGAGHSESGSITALARIAESGAPIADAGSGALAVEVHDDLAAVEPLWRALERDGVATPYQRFDWVRAYVTALAAAERFEPRIVVIKDAGSPNLLLPLAISRSRGVAVASVIGGKHANYHMPVLGRHDLSPAGVAALLRQVGRTRLKVDAFAFTNQPLAWRGRPNPLAATGQPSPSDGYRLTLEPEADRTLARALSRDTRKKLRQKEKKLAEIGAVAHLVARTPAEIEAVLAAFDAQKRARVRELGIPNPYGEAAVQAFVRDAALSGLKRGEPALELHALLAGNRIVATFGAAVDARRCCGMINSFDAAPEIARCSPGDLLMTRVIAWQCGRGRELFDLGVGEARYKSSLCDDVESLVDWRLPVTWTGRIVELVGTATGHAKRRIKRTPALWRIVTAARANAAKLRP